MTTTSPGARPFSITAMRSSCVATTTGRDSTVPSCFTTKTYWPCCPRCTAWLGATVASRISPSVTVATAKEPGQSVSSLFSKVALRRMVPVTLFTALSTKVSTPCAASPRMALDSGTSPGF